MFDTALFFGESHTGSVRRALKLKTEAPHRVLNVCHIEYPLTDQVFSHPLFNETLKVPSGSRPLYVSMLGGNSHNIMGLVVRDKPFDFVLPEEPDLESPPGYEPQTFGFVESVLRSLMTTEQHMIKAARNALSGPIIQLESPPPVANNDYIRKNIDPHLTSRDGNAVIASAVLRYKLWRLQSRIISETCADLDIEYLPAPSAALVDDRYLRSDLRQDATHTNEIYGDMVLNEIEKKLLL